MSEVRAAGLDERSALVVLAAVGLPGDVVTARLVRTVGAVETVRLGLEDVGPGGAPRSEMDHWRKRVRSKLHVERVETLLEATDKVGAKLLIPTDPGWPRGFEALGDHGPLAIWVRGDVSSISTPAIGVLGTRAATGYGSHMAAELAGDTVEQGLAVVSTGSYGVAAAAHRAALLSGGTTVAVLPGGIDRLYPAGNAGLLDQIVQAGALLSEAPPGVPPTESGMAQRGRLIAGLSSVVVVVEAPSGSGALVHAAQAAEFGRPVGAIPGPVTSAASAGSNRLMRDEIASLVRGIDDVASLALRAGRPLPKPATTRPVESFSPDIAGRTL